VYGAAASGAGNETPPPRERDLLDALLQCGDTPERKLSRTELADHLCTFLVAGHESTTACLLWTIYELCRHPDIQSRCQQEIDALLMQDGVRARYLGSAELNKIDYTVQVLKESMRLHPVTGSITRNCEAECVVGGYKLKPGTTVVLSILAIHKHPDFWSDPLLFKPERFSRENIRGTVKHPYQYMPFSAGARSCIGQRVALMEILVVLCTLLSQFTFALAAKDCKSVQEEETFTIHPKDLNVVVSLRRNVAL
jgi:cytochrome P450